MFGYTHHVVARPQRVPMHINRISNSKHRHTLMWERSWARGGGGRRIDSIGTESRPRFHSPARAARKLWFCGPISIAQGGIAPPCTQLLTDSLTSSLADWLTHHTWKICSSSNNSNSGPQLPERWCRFLVTACCRSQQHAMRLALVLARPLNRKNGNIISMPAKQNHDNQSNTIIIIIIIFVIRYCHFIVIISIRKSRLSICRRPTTTLWVHHHFHFSGIERMEFMWPPEGYTVNVHGSLG